MPKVSVLIAAYNASRFLPACLDSLAGQTLADIQILCIDDGSTDQTLTILQSRAMLDPRFEVYHLSRNQGQGHARNEGLRYATGDYICFLDADDWLDPDSLEQAVAVFQQHTETDTVLFNVLLEDTDHRRHYSMPSFEWLSGLDAFRLSLTWKLHGVYMVRQSIHRRFPYDESCRAYADDNTTRLHYLASRQVRCCTGVYHYRQHPSSVTHAVSVRRYDYLCANESMRRSLLLLQVEPDLLAAYENQRWLNLVDVYMFHFVHGRQLTRRERLYGLAELRRVWRTIDRSLLDVQTISKFGYRPMSRWWLFRCEEWLYFTLRGLLGKNY